MPNNHFPLYGPPPNEVPLEHAPLVKVLSQVMFPQLMKIKEGKDLSEFQELIRDDYPFLERDEVDNRTIEFAADIAKVRTEQSVIWRFFDTERKWRVSLAPNFIALEADAYSSRKDMLQRLKKLVSATETVYDPKIATRLGMRYIDQIRDDAYDQISSFVRSEILGVFDITELDRLEEGMTEAKFRADEGMLMMRCVHLPAGATFDPSLVKPIGSKSWVLDLDLSTGGTTKFATDEIQDKMTEFSERLYSAFRWLVTDEFLRHYGGTI